MGDHFYSQAQDEPEDEEEDAEESLSLSDLPLHDQLTSNEAPLIDFSNHPRRSSSQPQDFFEFFSDNFSSDHLMCSADDIIICGKLVPFKESYRSPNPTSNNPFAEENQEEEEEQRKPQSKAALGLRSRSESSSNFHSPKTRLTRNSRSLDYRKLRRFSSSVSNSPETVNTSSSVKSFRKSADVLAKRATRPSWSVFVFGIAKFPAEMELEDIKTRQLRRNPTNSLFVPTETRGNISAVSRSKGSTWKLLKALSCKDHTSVAVTSTSFACLPQSESFA